MVKAYLSAGFGSLQLDLNEVNPLLPGKKSG